MVHRGGGRMRCQVRSAVLGARALTMLLFEALTVSSALAQAPAQASPSNGWDNAYYQIQAESLRRAGYGKWVYTSDGHAIGRIVDVRTSPDGMHEVAVVGVRPLMGGGQVALPIYRLSRRKGRIVATDDRATVPAMERLRMASGGRR